jgi:hypothetical protein
LDCCQQVLKSTACAVMHGLLAPRRSGIWLDHNAAFACGMLFFMTVVACSQAWFRKVNLGCSSQVPISWG